MSAVEERLDLALRLAALDAWLETMRGPGGYGGPVAHWWHNCLRFTGPGLDWRYEGIVIGYLNLYEKTGDPRWRERARRAGDDLIRGQLPGGNFRDSHFELNPYSGGTPHEAADSLALLALAGALKTEGDAAWGTYLGAAVRNIKGYFIARLWDTGMRMFSDGLDHATFVPNKAATLAEALFKLAAMTGDETFATAYALPTLETILAHQVRGGPLDGAIDQYSEKRHRVAWYFPFYIARCIPGLVAGYAWTQDERYLDAAGRAMGFVCRWREEDGSFPQVIYPGGRVNRYPKWVAGVGDILRAMAMVNALGFACDQEPTRAWLLAGQESMGGFRTAWGFAAQASQRPPGPLPEFRDLLPICGWTDKAFRYLSEALPSGSQLPTKVDRQPFAAPCTVRGRRMTYREDDTQIELLHQGTPVYRWRKGDPWVEIATREVVWK